MFAWLRVVVVFSGLVFIRSAVQGPSVFPVVFTKLFVDPTNRGRAAQSCRRPATGRLQGHRTPASTRGQSVPQLWEKSLAQDRHPVPCCTRKRQPGNCFKLVVVGVAVFLMTARKNIAAAIFHFPSSLPNEQKGDRGFVSGAEMPQGTKWEGHDTPRLGRKWHSQHWWTETVPRLLKQIIY